ncbi:MAG: glycosyltransferase [Syntrophobacter sp.]
MDISIIITCLNEEKNLAPCLNSLMNQIYDAGSVEIIVADGGSTDRTHEIVTGFQKQHSNIFLVIEKKKGTAAGRNAGLRISRFKHVAFIDADCEAPRDWLATLVLRYREIQRIDRNVVAVGGGNIPHNDASKFEKAIGIALDCYLGSFRSAQGRKFQTGRYVPSLANLNVLYDKEVLLQVGGYDESLKSEAEDADINYRLHCRGYKFWFVPESFVWHKMRPTPRTWFKNMFRYGKGRARLLKRYPGMWAPSFLMPPLFLLVMASVLLAPLWGPFGFGLCYFPLILLMAIVQCLKAGAPLLVCEVFGIYLIQHFGFALGEVYGLAHPRVR